MFSDTFFFSYIYIYNIHRLPEIRCDVRSGMCSQELSDSLSKILADFFSACLSGISAGILYVTKSRETKLGIICVFASDGVFSGTLFGILSDMAFDILSDILLTCLMMLYLKGLRFFIPWSDWQSIWLSILSEILSDMFFLHSTWHIFWRDIWHSTWYLGIYSYMFSACLFGILTGVFLAVYLRQILRAFLTFELTFDHRALCCLQWIQVSLKGTFRRIIPNMGIAKNH